jgi:hypothetical protein
MTHIASTKQVDELKQLVANHPGTDCRLYAYLRNKSTLAESVEYLEWLSQQGPYSEFLRRWDSRIPAYIHTPFFAHIAEEEGDDHAGLFRKMMTHLKSLQPIDVKIDQDQIAELNYTFSERCVKEQDYGFFLGSFFATETTSPKRIDNLLMGLLRLGVAREPLAFLDLHVGADAAHAVEIADLLIAPMLEREPELYTSVRKGILDRLDRAQRFLDWYADRIGI